MAKRSFGLGAFNWLVVLAAVLALVYYLYEGGKFSEGGCRVWSAGAGGGEVGTQSHDTCMYGVNEISVTNCYTK